ncbi:MAG: hypothetical protein ACLFUE_05525 [Desulfobacteraceae bacterium]
MRSEKTRNLNRVGLMDRNKGAVIGLVFVLLLISAASSALCQDREEFRRRMEAVQRQMEEALGKGEAPPPEVLKEMQNLLPAARRAEAQKAGDWSPFSQDEGWRRVPFQGEIRVHRTVSVFRSGADGSLSKQENAVMTISVNDTAEVDVAGKKQLYPSGTISTTVNGREVQQYGDGSCTHIYNLTGKEDFGYDPDKAPQRRMTLEVNDEKGLFRLDVPMGTAKGSCLTIVKGGPVEKKYTSQITADVAAWFPGGCGRIEEESFSPQAGVITGSFSMIGYQALGNVALSDGAGRTWSENDPELQQVHQSLGANEMIPVRYQVTWNLFTSDERPRVVLEPAESYQTWIPELPNPEAGNTIVVKARIVEPPDVQGTIRFELRDVSREPGTCMNRPLGGADTDPDLIIPADKNSFELSVAGDEQSGETLDEVREARVIVQTRDWGAYGKLHAAAILHIGGQEIEVQAVYEAAGTPWVTLPQDEDNNSIADEWQRQNGLQDLSGAADEDDIPEGSGPGDGLSLYEEYRGFSLKGTHARLDPKVKDLFIFDQDGLAADSYLEQATHGLKLRYVTADEMCLNGGACGKRVVNFNHDRYHVVDQHGLHVKAEPGSKGRYNWGRCHGHGPIGPPVTSEYVAVHVDQIEADIRRTFRENDSAIRDSLKEQGIVPDEKWLQAHARDAIRMITTHETCHGLGVMHHVKTLPPGATHGSANPSFGMLMCVMRYPWDWGTAGENPIKPADEVIYILQGKWPWPNTLCTTMDNCAAQLTVSDLGH